MAPKGGNTKKESGRAKKAENESKKKATEAAEKVRKTPSSLYRIHHLPTHRKEKRQLSGTKVPKLKAAKKRKKKNVRPTSLEGLKMPVCSPRKKLRLYRKLKPPQRQGRSLQKTLDQQALERLLLQVAKLGIQQNHQRLLKVLLRLGLTMHSIYWRLLPQRWTKRVLDNRQLGLKNIQRYVVSHRKSVKSSFAKVYGFTSGGSRQVSQQGFLHHSKER